MQSSVCIKPCIVKDKHVPYTRINVCVVHTNGGMTMKQEQRNPMDEYIVSIPVPPDSGLPMAVMISPECGEWALDHVMVNGTRYIQKDGCMFILPPIVSEEVRLAMLEEYDDFKSQIFAYHVMIALGGSCTCYALDNMHSAVPFSIGAISSMMYLFMLQAEVDSIGKNNTVFFANKAVRVVMLYAVAYFGAHTSNVSIHAHDLFVALMGFLTYKMAILAAHLDSPKEKVLKNK